MLTSQHKLLASCEPRHVQVCIGLQARCRDSSALPQQGRTSPRHLLPICWHIAVVMDCVGEEGQGPTMHRSMQQAICTCRLLGIDTPALADKAQVAAADVHTYTACNRMPTCNPA
jgi:hypothetical protein